MHEIRCEFEAMGFEFRKAMLAQLRLDVKSVREIGFPAVAAKVATRARKATRAMDKIFNGTFQQGWAWEAAPDGGYVKNVAPHARRVEFGTPPGTQVDWYDLHEWVRVKMFGLPRREPIPVLNFGRAVPLTGGEATLFRQKIQRSRKERAARRSSVSSAAREDEARNVTNAVVRNIHDHGIEPTFIFRDALLGAPRDLTAWVKVNLPFKEEIPF